MAPAADLSQLYFQSKQRRERERRQQQAQANMQVLTKTQKNRERSVYVAVHLVVWLPPNYFVCLFLCLSSELGQEKRWERGQISFLQYQCVANQSGCTVSFEWLLLSIIWVATAECHLSGYCWASFEWLLLSVIWVATAEWGQWRPAELGKCTHRYSHVDMHSYTCIGMLTCTHSCTCTCFGMHKCAWLYVCARMHTHTHTHIHTHTQTHIHTHTYT